MDLWTLVSNDCGSDSVVHWYQILLEMLLVITYSIVPTYGLCT